MFFEFLLKFNDITKIIENNENKFSEIIGISNIFIENRRCGR